MSKGIADTIPHYMGLGLLGTDRHHHNSCEDLLRNSSIAVLSHSHYTFTSFSNTSKKPSKKLS